MLYRVEATLFQGAIFKARTVGSAATFNFTLLDADAFQVGEPFSLDLRSRTQLMDDKGEPQGLQWTGSEVMSLARYLTATCLEIGWSGFPASVEQADR